MEKPRGHQLVRAMRRAEKTLRWAGSLLFLPGWVRNELLERANDLERLLIQEDGAGR